MQEEQQLEQVEPIVELVNSPNHHLCCKSHWNVGEPKLFLLTLFLSRAPSVFPQQHSSLLLISPSLGSLWPGLAHSILQPIPLTALPTGTKRNIKIQQSQVDAKRYEHNCVCMSSDANTLQYGKAKEIKMLTVLTNAIDAFLSFDGRLDQSTMYIHKQMRLLWKK